MQPITLNKSFDIVFNMTVQERYILLDSQILKKLIKKDVKYLEQNSIFSLCQNFIIDLSYYFCGLETEYRYNEVKTYIETVLNYQNVSYQIDLTIKEIYYNVHNKEN